jgi:hypothetical protein
MKVKPASNASPKILVAAFGILVPPEVDVTVGAGLVVDSGVVGRKVKSVGV